MNMMAFDDERAHNEQGAWGGAFGGQERVEWSRWHCGHEGTEKLDIIK